MLIADERSLLLRVARESITAHLQGRPLSVFKPSPRLLEHRGAFVSLHKNGRLRGCIGYVDARKPLIDTIQEVALKAATEDPRFPPVTALEMPEIDIEISILTTPERVTNPNQIVPGQHGILLELGTHRGLLLPQVAKEFGWDTTTFLGNVALKAGLPPSAWKNPATKLYTFTAEVFSERSPL